jgi:murein DD-endopeptidase MepM/ murein hydrolase activator NlpD
MTHPTTLRRPVGLALTVTLALTACERMDFDLRGQTGAFSTTDAALNATASRPKPDDRGIISYPNYQVAVARRGDTLNDVAARIGVDAETLGSFNGIQEDAPLRAGEIIALPQRVGEPSPATGAITTGPIRPASVDVTTLAGQAIDNAPATAPTATRIQPAAQSGAEPIRHKVVRGETAYSIARLYNVPVRSLAEWNGLGSQFTVREGQYLLIPVGEARPPAPIAANTAPGEGSPTPAPPSAEKPLPKETTAVAAEQEAPKPVTDLGKQTKPASTGRFAYPVQGTIIREYAKGRNEGINIKADPGTSVKAAEAGTVAAITESAEGVPIIVVRHADNLLTVYANVTDVSVAKGDSVRRGQGIAKLRSGDQSFVHFEVREGFESVDPNSYLN